MDTKHLFEALEGRILVSATPMVQVGPDNVIVVGSEGPDHIKVESIDTGSGMMTTVQVNGVKVKTEAKLKFILVEGMGGDDDIEYHGIHMNEVPNLNFGGNGGNDKISVREVARTDPQEYQWTTVNGGDGDDRVEIYSTRYANIRGGDGNDTLISLSDVGNAWHSLSGDEGDDFLINKADRGAALYGGEGNDVLRDKSEGQGSFFDAGPGQNVAFGGPGSDTFYIKDLANNYFFGGSGGDWTTVHSGISNGNLYFDGQDGEDAFETRLDLGQFNFDLVSVERVYSYESDYFGKG